MKCKEVTRLLSESLDRELPWRARIGIWLHFVFCRCCARYVQNVRLIREVFKHRRARLEVEPAAEEGPALSDEARDRMKNLLKPP